MKTFIIACVVAVAIAVVSALILNGIQMPVGEAFMSGTSVRI